MLRFRIGLVSLGVLLSAGTVVVVASAGGTARARPSASPPISLTAFPGASWPATGGDLANSRYSRLTQINPSNVKSLTRAWTTTINPGFKTGPVESPPTVVGSKLFVSSSRGAPAALDPATGQLKWVTDPTTVNIGPGRGLASAGNGRGQAYGDGKIFEGQADGTITAYNADTGTAVWKTVINTGGVPTYAPATPIYYNHTVYTSL